MLTSKERILRAIEHKSADRIPIMEIPWDATIQRWHKEGLPDGVPWWQFFGVDHVAEMNVDVSPRYPRVTIEDTDEYEVFTSPWGVTMKQFKHSASVPEFLDFKIVNKLAWSEAKSRIAPTSDRVDWEYLKLNYPGWQKDGAWIQANLWFGFDVTHSWAVGTERLLMAMVEDPQWCVEMFGHCLDMCITLYDMIWDAGYKFDCAFWCDDMGYKQNQFFSLNTYREMVKPFHKKAVDWAHAKGIKVRMHSCGDIRPFIPELIEIGVDCLNPIEVKAGMDPIAIKKQFGSQIALHGGIDALLWENKNKLIEVIQSTVPKLNINGGYIFSIDHSIPSSASLKDYKEVIEIVKKL